MKTKTIVIVEDNELNLELAIDLLEIHGYNVLGIRSAEEALHLIARLQPDLVLMDIALPGMDGLEAAKRLKSDEKTVHIPVVVVSAHAMQGDRESAVSAGCAGYMTKPIQTRTFVQSIEKLMEEIDDLRIGSR